ncbi:MAG: cupredoxin domain-containing protein, partial [Patescibacteria group bacterium]
MNKKNYLWIGVGILAVVIIILLVVKNTNKEGESVVAPNGSQEVADTTTEPVAEVPAVPLSDENAIVADGKTFTPKTMTTKLGQKVFVSFSATDEAVHNFGFIDPQLSFLKVTFSKAEGKKSVTFPAPGAGTYTYYVDDQANTGKLTIT